MPASAPSPIPALRVLVEDGDVPPAAVSPGPSPSLLDVLERVEDPRQRRGVRHRLSSILLISVSVVLAGARSYAAIADWAEDIDEATRAGLGLGGAFPHASTIRRLLQALNPAALEAAVSMWVRSHRDAFAAAAPPGPVRKRRTVLAVDGKTLRGAHGGDGQPVKLVAVYDHAHQLILTQVRVQGGDESAAFTAALDTLPNLHGYLITAAGLHTQREHATYLHSVGRTTCSPSKATSPPRTAAPPWAQVPLTRARQHGHGRAEPRTCQVLTLPQAEQHTLFPGAVQVIKVVQRRRRQRSGTPSTQTVYLVTSLSARHTDPALIAGRIQDHRAIENTIHKVRNITYGEDSSAVRTSTGPQVMAALRNLAMNLTRLHEQANIARAHHRYAHQPTRTADDLHTT